MWTLKISKDRHKFSASHFTIFSEKEAEPLHGHNYYVGLEVKGQSLDDQELLIDVVMLKNLLSKTLEAWDEKVLLPKNSPYLTLSKVGESMKVEFHNRSYTFPLSEVELLDVKNITMESLAKLTSDMLFSKLKNLSHTVFIQESRGQEASFTYTVKGKEL